MVSGKSLILLDFDILYNIFNNYRKLRGVFDLVMEYIVFG